MLDKFKTLFLDLEFSLNELRSTNVDDRVHEFCKNTNDNVYIVAISGFPIKRNENIFEWCGSEVSIIKLSDLIKQGLGSSALLTFMNKSKLSTSSLGDICIEKNHDWAYRWITLSLLFVGLSPEVELAFSRDCSFLMSWPVTTVPTGKLFIANGSLKDWIKFLFHFNDKDLNGATREAMIQAKLLLNSLLPQKKELNGNF